MKRGISSLLLVLLLVGCVGIAVGCADGDTDGAATTVAVTEAPTATLTAADVDAKIAAIDGATLANEKAIDEAYLAYCSLSAEERAKVTGLDTLQAYRSELTKAYVVKDYRDTRIPHHKLLIGSYRVPATSETNLQALLDCHFDFIWNANTTTLDLVAEKGLGVFQRTSTFDNLEWYLYETEEAFRAAIAGLNPDHEAVWAIDHTDEPKGQEIVDYWKYGKIVAEELFPQSAAFMNLNPFYGYGNRLDWFTPDLDLYFSTVGTTTDIACFDHYVYMSEVDHQEHADYNAICSLLDNLSVFSAYCRQNGQDMFMIGQQADPMDLEPKYVLSTEQIKFQAYTALAYGAKSISWYSMEAYSCFILDENGNRTALFDKLEETNGDLKALEPVFMRYSGASNVVLCGSKCPTKRTLEPYQGNCDTNLLTQESLTDLAVDDKNAMLVGHFEKNVGEGEAFLFVGITNYRFTKDQLATATFKTADPNAVVTAYVKGEATRLIPDANGVYTVEVVNADAVFVTVD